MMHQTVIGLDQWADVFDRLTTFTQTKAGDFLVTAGEHPNLGGIVAKQDWQEAVIFCSEHPAYGEFEAV